MGGAFGRIARLLRHPTADAGDPVADAELLGRFVHSADQAAFELLVWRHAVMVYGVCRRIVRDEHLAEDAFQATFLVLARKAGSVRGANLAGWLFRVARRVAVRARTRAAARAQRETPLATEPAAPGVECGELAAILDEEIGRLPERFRLPVVLCYLGGRTTEDAARLLGCPRGTVLSRLATARTRLAARLTRRGVTVPATLFAVTAVPSGLAAVAPLVPVVLRLTVSKVPTGSAVVLAQGVITAMRIGKTMATAGVVVLAVGMVSGVGWLAVRGTGADGGRAEAGGAPRDQPAARPPLPVAEPDQKKEHDEIRRRQENDTQVKKLEKLADEFRQEIAARERAIRQLAASGTIDSDPAKHARRQQTLAALESELFALECEIQTLNVQKTLLDAKIKAGRFEAEASDLARLVDMDPRVAVLLAARTEKEAQLAREQKLVPNEAPALVELKEQLAKLNKEIEARRQEVRPEITGKLQAEVRTRSERQLADLREKLDQGEQLLRVRKQLRDELEKSIKDHTRQGINLDLFLKELEPQREFLRKIETRLMELRVERALGVSLPGVGLGVEAKLDKLIREVEELRLEVRELRKRE